jgi:hypothetical protein
MGNKAENMNREPIAKHFFKEMESFDRKSEFKTGIENKTEKRAETLSKIIGKKRDAKIFKLRHTPSGASAGGGPLTSPAPSGANSFAPNVGGLKHLFQYLDHNCNNEKELDANVMIIFPTIMDEKCNEIDLLVDCLHGSRGPECNSLAIKCLFILSVAKFHLTITFASHLFQNGKFLEYTTKHLELNTPIVLDVWKTLCNVAVTCKETRDMIMDSPISKVHFPKFFTNRNKEETDQVAYYFISAIITTGAIDLPPNEFIKGVWLDMVERIKLTKQFLNSYDDGNDAEIVDCILYSFYQVGQLADPVFLKELVRVGEQKAGLIHFMCHLNKAIKGAFLFWTIEFLNSAMTADPEFVSGIATKICVEDISVRCEDLNSRISQAAIKWIGNYAIISYTNIEKVMASKSLNSILNIITHGRRYAKELAISIEVIEKIVFTCLQSLRKMDKRAEYVLDFILFDSNIIRKTVHFIRRDDNEMIYRILRLWTTLMDYKKEDVLSFLIQNNAMDHVETLVYSNNTDIYKLANKIQTAYDIFRPQGGDEDNLTAVVPMEFDF